MGASSLRSGNTANSETPAHDLARAFHSILVCRFGGGGICAGTRRVFCSWRVEAMAIWFPGVRMPWYSVTQAELLAKRVGFRGRGCPGARLCPGNLVVPCVQPGSGRCLLVHFRVCRILQPIIPAHLRRASIPLLCVRCSGTRAIRRSCSRYSTWDGTARLPSAV